MHDLDSKVAGPQHSYFWNSYVAHTARHTTTKFCMIKLDKRNMFTGSTTPVALAKNSVTQTLMRDLLSVANLV